MEESKIENSSADTELAVVEKDNSDDKNVSNGDAEVIEKDPDIRKDDTYRIYDYLKANPVLTVAILSGTAALITFLLNLVVFIVGWREQRVQGLSFYFSSNSNQWYYMALISLLTTIILSCYSFLAADAGEVISYNNIMLRYAKEYSRYAKTCVDNSKKAIKIVKRELKKERRKEKKGQKSKYRNDAELILEKKYNKAKSSIKEISEVRAEIAKKRRYIVLTTLPETITMLLLYGAISLLYFSLATNKLLFAILPTLVLVALNALLLWLNYSLSVKKESVPKCTNDNADDFCNKMAGYMNRERRKSITVKLKEKGFRVFFSDRVVFNTIQMIVIRLTITCIIVAVMMACLPQMANEFRITEYEDKTYIVVAKNDNNYALIEASLIDENTLEVYRKSERYITTDDLLIVTKSFKSVNWIDTYKQEQD